MYEPLQVVECKRRRKIIPEPKIFCQIIQGKVEYWRDKVWIDQVDLMID
jgi:hypothetical protein